MSDAWADVHEIKQWDGFAKCLVPEATGDHAGLTFENS